MRPEDLLMEIAHRVRHINTPLTGSMLAVVITNVVREARDHDATDALQRALVDRELPL